MDPSIIIDIIKTVAEVVQSFMDADKAFTQVLRDFPPLLERCKELVTNIKLLNVQTIKSSETLRQFGEELTASATLMKKWQAKLSVTGDFRVLNILRSKARLSRISDMMASMKTFREELMQVLQVEQTSIADAGRKLQEQGNETTMRLLSAVRKGSFNNYTMVKNEKARNFWVANFPGRQEVPWGEFRNMMRWQEFMTKTDDLGRTRAFYWIKAELDENCDHLIHIGEWNNFTKEKADYETTITGFFRQSVPDEDDVDRADALPNKKAADAPKSPLPLAKLRGGNKLNPLLSISALLENDVEQAVQKLGIASAARTNHNDVHSIDVAFLVDCTGTMGDRIQTLYELLPNLMEDVRRSAPGVTVRVAFVGYRDIGDDEPFSIYPFTENIQRILTFMESSATACGGGLDAAEDVLGGLEKAANLEWSFGSGTSRRLVHIADAPSHGTRYHTFADRTKDNSWNEARERWDRFAEFDANGLKGRQLMSTLARKKIDYSFVQVVPFTVKMTDQFKEWYNASSKGTHLPMDVLELGNLEELPVAICAMVRTSIEAARK